MICLRQDMSCLTGQDMSCFILPDKICPVLPDRMLFGSPIKPCSSCLARRGRYIWQGKARIVLRDGTCFVLPNITSLVLPDKTWLAGQNDFVIILGHSRLFGMPPFVLPRLFPNQLWVFCWFLLFVISVVQFEAPMMNIMMETRQYKIL